MQRVGVVGAGTMGAGIAQTSAVSGFETVIFDPVEGAGEAGLDRIRSGVQGAVARGALTGSEGASALRRVALAGSVSALAGCTIVVEAAPEQLELKRAVFRDLARVCGEETILATNTSSIPVTSIAVGVPAPARVVGTHFFNPVPRMRLVEVVPALQTSVPTLETAVAFCRALAKTPIVVEDVPGFLVNRCARPFSGEGLRLLQERVAAIDQIDRICRLGGGFRMGPFELMDLVGNDVSLAVARSLSELSFGEARWRPSPLQQRLVASGNLGRKSGAGWYSYAEEWPADPAPGAPDGPAVPPLAILGENSIAARLRAALAAADRREAVIEAASLVVVADSSLAAAALPAGRAVAILSCSSRSLAAWERPEAVGFSLVPGDPHRRLVELTTGERTPVAHAGAAASLFRALGFHVEWVEDSPGLVLARIVAQLINEACFAVGEGVASAEAVDEGVRLGLNYPHGPFEWAETIGWPVVLDVIEGLWRERREERYRPAPLLQRRARQARAGTEVGGG